MSPAPQARDSWADTPTRRPRREAVSWASAEDLEILGGLGEDPVADWTVLTIEREDGEAGPRDVAGADGLVRLDQDRAERRRPTVSVPRRISGPARRRAEHVDAVTERMTVPAVAVEPAPVAPRAATDASDPGDGRRTVVIRGQAKPLRMDLPADRRRPAPRPRDRVGHRPDRVAMWAVMLGLLLIVVATMTAG